MYTEGETDELPSVFAGLLFRRMIYKDYGVVLPDFGPDELMAALYLRNVEATRERNDARKGKHRAAAEGINYG